MTTQEHLNKILEKCRAFLEIAEKRTPGEWHETPKCYVQSGSEVVADIWETTNGEILANAAFIAACAGQAEAMARSTIAAIEWLQAMIDLIAEADPHCPHHSALQPHITKILTAWPEELL